MAVCWRLRCVLALATHRPSTSAIHTSTGTESDILASIKALKAGAAATKTPCTTGELVPGLVLVGVGALGERTDYSMGYYDQIKFIRETRPVNLEFRRS